MGHMNVRHYFGRANDGLSVLWLHLGLSPRALAEQGLIVRAQDQHIRFSKELRPGEGFLVRAGGLQESAPLLTTYQELRTVDDEISATIVSEVGLLQRDSGDVVQWPEPVQGGLGQLRCELPQYAAPRGVVARACRKQLTRDDAVARGMLPGFLGPVAAADCDAYGVMTESACMGRISDGISHFFRPLQQGDRPQGVGGAALEYRFVFHAWPKQSDIVEVRSALSALNNKAMQVTHYMFDLATGSCVASAQAVVVWFDLAARKSVPFPDATREQLQRRVLTELPV